MKNLCWSKYTSIKQLEEIDEPMRIGVAILYAAGILLVGVFGFVLVVIGLSL